jgi:uncharacterized membrane protein YkvA (DUF1232 family)
METDWLPAQHSTTVHLVPSQDAHIKWSMRHTVAIVLCALWMISPVDPIPELLFGPLGFADDAVALVVGIVAFLLGSRTESVDGRGES